MKISSTIQRVLERIDIEKILLKMQLNSTYSADSETSLKQSDVIQAKFKELTVVQNYLENLIKEQ